MANVALLLGPIVFQDFEVPCGITFGGRQRLALHRLPGGSRTIDALGRDDAQIGFCGIFTGADATLRARSIDALRVAGAALPLTWDVLFYTVLISEFLVDYRMSWWIPYRIVCTVLRDEASALVQPVVSLANAALADISAATGYASNTTVDLSSLAATLSDPAATTRGTLAYAAAQSSLSEAQTSISSSIATAGATLAGTSVSDSSSAEAGAARLTTATEAAGRLSSLSLASAYVRRTATNLANAST